MSEEVLVDIKVSGTENKDKVDNLTGSITTLTKANKDLQAEQKKLEKEGKENTKQYKENAAQIELNKQKINENTASRKGLIQAMVGEDNSIKALKVRNAELIKQRDLVNISTIEGKRRIQEINAEIDKNNEAIKGNVSSLEKQKINIGNYASALDGVIPGLGGFVTGIQNATKAGLTFIATPIGAVIGAIGLALAALATYFRGVEEGQDDFNKLVQVGNAVMAAFKDVVIDVGRKLFKLLTEPKEALRDFGKLIQDNLLNRLEGVLLLVPRLGQAIGLLFKGEFVEAGKLAFNAVSQIATGVENILDKTIAGIDEIGEKLKVQQALGIKVADKEREIRLAQRQFDLDQARARIEVGKLREEALKTEGQTRIDLLEKAIAIERKLSDEQVALARKRLELAKLKADFGQNDIAENDMLVAAEVAVMNAEAERYENTRRLISQLEAEKERVAAEDARRAEEARKREEEEQKRKTDDVANVQKQVQDLIAKNNKELEKSDKKNADKRVEIERKANESIGELSLKLTKDKIDIAKTAQNFFKEGAAKETIANAKAAANAAYKALASIPVVGPVLGGIAYAFVLARGLADAAGIRAIQFQRGGIAQTGGVLTGPSHAQGGIPFSVGGRTGFEAEGGEAIINKRSTAMFRPLLSTINQKGGGVAFETGGITGMETRQALSNAQNVADFNALVNQINTIQTILVLEDVEAKQRSRSETNRTARVISR